MFFDPSFPDQDALKSIFRRHGLILFQPFDQEGLRVESLNLEVDTLAQFRMQPCRFLRSNILRPLKVLIDQFVSEGVLVSDISCTHASPFVIFHKMGCLSIGRVSIGSWHVYLEFQQRQVNIWPGWLIKYRKNSI